MGRPAGPLNWPDGAALVVRGAAWGRPGGAACSGGLSVSGGTLGGMGDDKDDLRDRARRQRGVLTPANEVPVWLPWSAVLARTENVAVLLVGARLYTTGIQLDLSVRGRGNALLDLHAAALGRPNVNGDVLCLGVQGADGFAATNVRARSVSGRAGTPSLTSSGGGGSHGTVATSYLLHPVPPSGPVTMWCAWPVQGIEETATEFDGSALGELLEQVEVLWPEDEPTSWPPTPPMPNVPLGGWFEAHVSNDRGLGDTSSQGPSSASVLPNVVTRPPARS